MFTMTARQYEASAAETARNMGGDDHVVACMFCVFTDMAANLAAALDASATVSCFGGVSSDSVHEIEMFDATRHDAYRGVYAAVRDVRRPCWRMAVAY